MGFDFDKGQKERDEQLRRSMLEALYNSRQVAMGGLNGRTLVRVLPGGDAGIEDDDHAVKLMRDLVNLGVAQEKLLPRRRGERFGPDYLFMRITGLGVNLIDEHVPAVPGIRDERITDE
jgi:hypothetical protein